MIFALNQGVGKGHILVRLHQCLFSVCIGKQQWRSAGQGCQHGGGHKASIIDTQTNRGGIAAGPSQSHLDGFGLVIDLPKSQPFNQKWAIRPYGSQCHGLKQFFNLHGLFHLKLETWVDFGSDLATAARLALYQFQIQNVK
jgi:hypothetical protein